MEFVRKMVAWPVVVAVVVVAAVAGDRIGRAEPVGSYRPDLVGDTVVDGCYPLPGDVQLPLAHVVRTDTDVEVPGVGPRRELVLHWSDVDAAEALSAVEGAFVAAGFTATRSGDAVELRRDGAATGPSEPPERVVVTAYEFDTGGEDLLVRGEMTLDLPVTEPARTDAPCDNVFTTKRFGPLPEQWWP